MSEKDEIINANPVERVVTFLYGAVARFKYGCPDTMNDLGMADSEELVEVFGFSGDRVELPEEAVIPYTFGQAASLSSSDLHRFRTHNTSIARAMGPFVAFCQS